MATVENSELLVGLGFDKVLYFVYVRLVALCNLMLPKMAGD